MRFICVLFFIAASQAGLVLPIPDVELNTPDLQDPRVPWMSEGCYKEPLGRRALAQAAFYDYSGMTVEKCQSFCARKGYPYAGLEYVGECYCGLVNNSPGVSDPSECYQSCAGNPLQICGGPDRLSLYSRSIRKPMVNSGENLFKPLGCFADAQRARLLSHFAVIPGGSDNVSVLECTKVCFGRGFIYAGLEYAGECWCDNEYRIKLKAIDASNCDMPCKGNLSDLCGGSDAINIYQYTPPRLLGKPRPIIASTSVVTPISTVNVAPIAPILSSVTSAVDASQTTVVPLDLTISPYPSTPVIAGSTATAASELTSHFEEHVFSFATVANPSYKDSSGLLGSIATYLGKLSGFDNVSVFNMSSQRTKYSNDRSYCLLKAVNLSSAGSYNFDVGVGRQILNGTGKPYPSKDRLQFNMYYDTTLVSGLQNVCNPSYEECSLSSPFGRYDIIKDIVKVPYRDIGLHNLAVCGIFRGHAVNGLDSILIYFVNFTGPIMGG